MNVAEMVANLVHGVDCDPSQWPLKSARVVVHHGSVPIMGPETSEDVGEHSRCVIELPRHGGRVLVGIAVMLDPLVPAHRFAHRPIRAPRSKNSLALHEQHITQVTAVLER
jgi:hypothetical protein